MKSTKTGSASPDGAGGKHRVPLGALAAVALALAVLAAVWLLLQTRAERALELADLQLMRVAEASAALRLKDGAVDGAQTFWFDPSQYALVPAEGTPPKPCGVGTRRAGGGARAFAAETGKAYEYDERADYRGSRLVVLVDPAAPEGERIRVLWRAADA